MSLAKKFTIIVLGSILFIAITNIVGFYIFYSSYLKIFLAEKIESKSQISLNYIHEIILKQTADDVDELFDDIKIDFFEKLWEDNIIKLDTKENVDLVINYLLKSWVAPKYIEEVVPTNNFEKVLEALKNTDSPEYRFIRNMFISIIITNILAIAIVWVLILIFAQRTLFPIREATSQIKRLKPWKLWKHIDYKAKDEIGLLISSINGLNRRLAVQENIKSKLLADISHELKTPITSIQCYLEWISDWVIKLNEKNLNSITSEMQRLIELVNRIMKFEQFENTSLVLNETNTNIADTLKQVVETHKKRLKETHQRIKVTWDDNLEIFLDADLLKQLTHNLIWNFLKYAWKNSLLTINVTKKYIDFSDNGHWIKKLEIPFLTEKFYQWDESKSANIDERWIWVWLSIVWKIIEAHGWSFRISSDTNKWFSFKVFF